MYRKGISVSEICKKENMASYSTIYKWIRVSDNIDVKNPQRRREAIRQEKQDKIIGMYKDGKEYQEIAKKLDISVGTVYKYIKKNSSIKHKKYSHNKTEISKSYKNKIIDMYKNKDYNYIYEIANELDLDSNTVSKWLKNKGIKLKRGLKNKVGEENFFNEINSEIKAYYLGWIMADGNVSKHNNQHSLKIHIHIKDKELIDSFLYFTNSSYVPCVKDNQRHYYVSLTSTILINDLIKHKVVPRKSGEECIPNSIPIDLKKHFIRGYFDGDGFVSVYTTNDYKTITVGFIGSKRILKQINNFTNKNRTIRELDGCYEIRGSQSYSKFLYNFMYKNSEIWLPRKKNKFESFFDSDTEITSNSNKLLVS